MATRVFDSCPPLATHAAGMPYPRCVGEEYRRICGSRRGWPLNASVCRRHDCRYRVPSTWARVRKSGCAPFLAKGGELASCLASSLSNHSHVVWHPEASNQDIPPWLRRQSTQLSVSVLGYPVQLVLLK